MIEIDKKWAIVADNLNILLVRKHTPKKDGGGKPYLVTEGYYSSLHEALHGLVEQQVRDTKLASLKILTDKLDEIYSLIKSLRNITVADLQETDKISDEIT